MYHAFVGKYLMHVKCFLTASNLALNIHFTILRTYVLVHRLPTLPLPVIVDCVPAQVAPVHTWPGHDGAWLKSKQQFTLWVRNDMIVLTA